MLSTLALVLLGTVAGVVTTIAGIGGGLFLVVALGLTRGPHAALALTAPALLGANVHRAWLFRAHVARTTALALAAGLVPGAVLGGVLLPKIPEGVVAALLAATTVLALLRGTGRIRFAPGVAGLVTGGAIVGLFAGASGGAAVLLAPLVLSTGLNGPAYVATVAIGGVALHLGRVAAYGGVGLLTRAQAPEALALFAGLAAGNLLGRWTRRWIPARVEPALELGALVVTTAVALAGLVR